MTAQRLLPLVVAGALLAVPTPAAAKTKEGTVRWSLADGNETLTTETQKVRISVTYGACTGEPGKPTVVRRMLSVFITVPIPPAEPLPPGVACPDIAYHKTMTVRLRGRLGTRALRDGSSMPPRFVARART